VTITKEISRLEKSNVKLTLTVSKDDVKAEYDLMLSEYLKTLQIPGFRKGKVPRDVLVRKFGDTLKQEASARIVEKSVEEAFKTEGENALAKEDRPLPYSQPEVKDEPKLDFDNDLQFSVEYDVLPKIEVGKWEGLETEVPDVAVTDEDINRELETIRDRNAIVQDKDESQEAAKGDVVTVNYCELDDNSQEIENTKRQDFVFTLGSGLNYFHFDDEITGIKKGESKDITKIYPADFEEKELAGQTKKLRVTLTALKEKKLPDLDDDLAQDVDEKFKTLDDLKADIRGRLETTMNNRITTLKNNGLLEKIMETTPAVIPESMIRIELDSRWRNLARRFNTDTNGLYKMLSQNGQAAQGILDEWRPDAEKAIHSRLIVETLMDNLKLEASDDEADKEIEKLTAESPDSADQIRQYYQSDEMKQYLKEDVREQKLFKILWEKNTVKPGKKLNYVELISNNN